MNQTRPAMFASEDMKFIVLCDSDMPLGIAHDHVMKLKGELVDKMVKAQKDQEAEVAAYKEQEASKECESGC